MAFPADPLDASVEFAFGADPSADPSSWTWTDVTADAKARVVVRRGRQSEDGDRLTPGSCLFRLDNQGGKYTPGHPMSPNWPNVRRDTPLRVQVNGVDRATQFAGDFRPGFDDSGGGPWEGAPICDVEAGGILRRLGQGDPPVYSPYRRSIMSPVNTGLLAYWPGEDDRDAQQAASAIPGQPGMTVAGTVVFGDAAPALHPVTGVRRFGTMPLPDLTGGGSLTGVVPAGSSSPTAWAVQFFSQSVDFGSGVANALTLASWRTPGGTYERWELHQDQSAGGSTRLRAIDSSGVSTDLIVLSGVIVGPDHYTIDAVQNGANIDVRLWFAEFFEGSFSGAGTLAQITEFSANPNRTVIDPADEFIIGHVRVWDRNDPPKMTFLEVHGWFDSREIPETATDRLARLCVEDGISLSMPAVDAAFETAMGLQPDGTALDLYRQCADADQGVLYESGFGLAYLPRQHRYNRPVALTLEKRHLATSFRTSVDDSTTRNDVTVARPGGSSARRADEEHIATHGRYTGGGPTRLASDDVLAEHAAWQVHLGTGEEIRYPKVTLNLHADPTLIPAWLACDIGSRIRITEAPDSLPPGEIDLIIDGWVETLDALEWTVELNCSPASPWNVFVLGDPIYGRLDTSGSSLAASADSTETSLLVATESPYARWITSAERPQDFPFNANFGGEVQRVQAVGEVLNANPFFETDAANWTAGGATIARSTVRAHEGVASLLITPDGVSGSGGAIAARVPVVEGESYVASLWAWATSSMQVGPAVDWFTALSGGSYISTGFAGPTTVDAGVWTPLWGTLVAPAGAAAASVRARHGGTPSAALTWWTDQVILILADSATTSPQTFTVVRSVNGVVKAHLAGADVRISRSAVGL